MREALVCIICYENSAVDTCTSEGTYFYKWLHHRHLCSERSSETSLVFRITIVSENGTLRGLTMNFGRKAQQLLSVDILVCVFSLAHVKVGV